MIFLQLSTGHNCTVIDRGTHVSSSGNEYMKKDVMKLLKVEIFGPGIHCWANFDTRVAVYKKNNPKTRTQELKTAILNIAQWLHLFFIHHRTRESSPMPVTQY